MSKQGVAVASGTVEEHVSPRTGDNNSTWSNIRQCLTGGDLQNRLGKRVASSFHFTLNPEIVRLWNYADEHSIVQHEQVSVA